MAVEAEGKLKQYTYKDRQFWQATVALAFASLFNFAIMYVVQPMLPEFTEQFNVSPAISSLSLTLTTVTLIAGLFIFGFLSDRFGRVAIMKLSLIGAIVPVVMIPLVSSFSAILVLRLVDGFFLAGLPAAAIAYIGEEIDKKSMGLAASLYIANNALGGMAGRVVGGYITDQYSWSAAFYVLGAAGVVIALLFVFMLPASRYFKPSGKTITGDMTAMAFHLKNWRLMPSFVMGLMLQVGFTGLWTYLAFYLQDPPFSLSLLTISWFYVAYIFGTVGSSFAGMLSSRFGTLNVMTFGVIIMVIGIVLTNVIAITAVAIGLALVCWGFFTAHSMAAAWVAKQATDHKAGASSLYLVSYYIGVVIGGTALGFIWDIYGWVGLSVLSFIGLCIAYVPLRLLNGKMS